MNAWAVVVAAGRGERAGLGMNKVFYPLGGRPVLRMTLDALVRSGAFSGAVVVLSEADMPRFRALLDGSAESFPVLTALGGATRQESVRNGLDAIPDKGALVAIHDGARPFVSDDVIFATLRAAEETGSGVISLPVTDTVKEVGEDGKVRTLDRSRLRSVQTPQSFRLAEILELHRRAEEDEINATDDAALYEYYNGTVTLVTAKGAEENIKLTTRADFEKRDVPFRVGSGYDAHRLVEDRKLILCGVEVPHDRGLLGHSDADVAVHALMDALLGSVGLGDIGRHFPDKDPQYKGISSMVLLDKVVSLLAENGYAPVNCDVTIVAQQPKLAPYIGEMRDNIARALGTDAVNVKATTTERMGFEGEEEGISASAVALVSSI